jgi:peptidoglycan/xylan/chitin deacetylase (PgdA/CDA1 family)
MMVKALIRKSLDKFLRLIPLGVYRRMIRRNPIGVFYHAVSTDPLPHIDHLYPPLTAAQFENALRYIKQHYTPVDYQRLHDHVFHGKPLPANALHLSFDDGYVENFTVVRPLLMKYEIPCTFFLTTDWLNNRSMGYRNKGSLVMDRFDQLDSRQQGNMLTAIEQQFGAELTGREDLHRWILSLPRSEEPKIDFACQAVGLDVDAYLAEHQPYLSTEQVLRMAAEGFTIGSHTLSHYKLLELDRAGVEEEIAASSRIIAEMTGQEIVPFSFPNTGKGLDRVFLEEVRERHAFLGLFFDTRGIARDVPCILNRIWAEHRDFPHQGAATNLPRVLQYEYRRELWPFGHLPD